MNEEIIEILEEMKEYASGGMTGLYFPEYMIQDLLDYITNLQQKVEQLEKKNKILKENAEHNDKVVDKVNWKNMLLNNIINELEKHLNQEIIEWQDDTDDWIKAQVQEDRVILIKLKELKRRNK